MALSTDPDLNPGDVLHLVLLRFRADVTDAQRAEIDRRFHALANGERDGRRYVRSIRSGPQISPEPGGHRFEVAYVVEFGSEGDRNYYLGRPFVGDDSRYDPDHDAFKAWLGPMLADGDDGLLVFDLLSPTAA